MNDDQVVLLVHESSKMTLNYWVIMERYPFPNGVVGGSIRAVKSSLYLTIKKSKQINLYNIYIYILLYIFIYVGM